MRSGFYMLIFVPFLFLGSASLFSQPFELAPEISAKADRILKLQEQILIQLKEIKEELYVIKIRVSRHNRTTGAQVGHH